MANVPTLLKGIRIVGGLVVELSVYHYSLSNVRPPTKLIIVKPTLITYESLADGCYTGLLHATVHVHVSHSIV